MARAQLAAPRVASATGIADGDLVLQAKDGNGWAFDALYRRHAQSIGGLAVRLLGARSDADDVVADTFVAAFESLHTLREPSSFRAWIVRIAVMRARRILRRRRLLQALGMHDTTDDARLERLASDDIGPEKRAELALIDAVLAELPADERIVWMLRHVEGHLLEDIASDCECSLSTVKRRLEAATRKITRAQASHGWRR